MRIADINAVFQKTSALDKSQFFAFTLSMSDLFGNALKSPKYKRTNIDYTGYREKLGNYLSTQDGGDLDIPTWPGLDVRDLRVSLIEYAFQFLMYARDFACNKATATRDIIISEFVYNFQSLFSIRNFGIIDFGDIPTPEFEKMKQKNAEYQLALKLFSGIIDAFTQSGKAKLTTTLDTIGIVISSIFSDAFFDDFV